MTKVFADTFYFIALLSNSDEAHDRAVAWSKSYSGQLVTTEWTLIELADALASSKRRSIFRRTRDKLLADPHYQLIPFDLPVYLQAITLYDSRPDKEWSLTDCISFAVMQREGLADALTGDHHFEQAGFVALLK